jgi:hypothetical protein
MSDEILFLEESREDIRWQANQRAARATQNWLIGRGLAAEAHDLMMAPMEGNTPAPGLFTAVRMMGDSCTDSCNAADTVLLLLRQEFDATSEEKLEAALEASSVAATEVERWMRRIAALCIGLSASLTHTDETVRSDRAAVVKLVNEPTTLVDDGLWHSSARFDEFSTELAGDLGRMIIDHDCILTMQGTGAEDSFRIEFEVDSVGNLSVQLSGEEEVDSSAMVELGWRVVGGTYRAEWDDPLAIVEPVLLVITTLVKHLHVPSPTELRFSIEQSGPVAHV